MQIRSIAVAIFAAATISATGYGIMSSLAAGEHDAHSAHGTTTITPVGSMPQEPGQSAFAAIAEIVAMLNDDPDTDWGKVNIAALRDHLVDMEMLTTEAAYTHAEIDGGIEFEVYGSKRSIEAARRMVPAHAQELSKTVDWRITTEDSDRGVKMIVQPTETNPTAKIKALGFFGIMATGAHHQPHHLGIATGSLMH